MSMATFSSSPMPPAPTRPSTTEERTAFSRANSVVVMKAGVAAGITAQKMVSIRRTPWACSASAGPLSTSSIASAKKAATKTGRVDGYGEGARERPEPDRDDENQRPDQIVSRGT
jgi:hypothetical protein